MDSLEQMSMIVGREINRRGIKLTQLGFTNQNRCYLIRTDEGDYILKWSKQMYKKVNYLPEFKGKGAGMTINKEFIDSVYKDRTGAYTTFLLFSTVETNTTVYGLPLPAFIARAAEHQQPANGEVVYAIPIRLLDKWTDGL